MTDLFGLYLLKEAHDYIEQNRVLGGLSDVGMPIVEGIWYAVDYAVDTTFDIVGLEDNEGDTAKARTNFMRGLGVVSDSSFYTQTLPAALKQAPGNIWNELNIGYQESLEKGGRLRAASYVAGNVVIFAQMTVQTVKSVLAAKHALKSVAPALKNAVKHPTDALGKARGAWKSHLEEVFGPDLERGSRAPSRIVKHHPVFKAAVKPGKRQKLFKLVEDLHVGDKGLHTRLLNSPYKQYMPTKGRSLKTIIEKHGAENWLAKQAEAMEWLEKRYPGDYTGLLDAFVTSVRRIGGTSGIKH